MDQEPPTPEPPPASVDAAPEPVAVEPVSAPSRMRRRLRVAVVLTLLAAVALLVWLQVSGTLRLFGGPSAAPTEALPSRIALVDGDGVLTTMDDQGGSLVRHPVDGVAFQFPAWSPDGARVAAIGSSTDEGAVYVFQARGDGAADPAAAIDPTVIYESPDRPPFYLYWTPDSRRVTFLTQEPDALALRVAPADGSSADFVVRRGAPLYWDWVDPARALVNVGAGGTDAFLGEVGLDGAAGQPAATASAFRAPAMTRDGSHRAYSIDAGAGAQTIVIEARNGADHHEIPVPGLAAFTFAQSGGSLAFIAPSAAGAQPPDLPIGPLRVVDVASGSVRTLQEGLLVAFFWSPDGRTIATLRIPAPGENEIASIGRAVPRPAVPSVAIESGYSLVLGFVDVATGELRSTSRVQVTNLFGLQILPFFDQYARSHRIWSRDSAAIVLPLVNTEGVDGVVVLPADGSGPRRLSDGEIGFWSP